NVFEIVDGKVKVNQSIVDNPSLLAASSVENEEGNGKWAIELANLQYISLDTGNFDIKVGGETTSFTNLPTLDGATFQSFYEGLIGQLGVDGQEANRLQYNTETIRLTVENNRASMSSVSLDEEMTNMISFQQAYNANARMITVIDETLDKIINGMGRVGL
ncbi:flagellar hook-associated protein FlgK, partial [Butyricicoccus sp. 1XD8-22]